MTVRITLLVAILGLSLPIFGQRPSGVIVNVNAASYAQPFLARGSLVAAFGRNLASGTATGEGVPLLLGTQILLEAADGLVVAAPLLFVSPAQVNYIIPNEITNGVARVELRTQVGASHAGYIEIVDSAPGIFTQEINGQAIARARLNAGAAYYCDSSGCRVVPGDLYDSNTIPNYIAIYGTGFLHCREATVQINDTNYLPLLRPRYFPDLGEETVIKFYGLPPGSKIATVTLRCGETVSNPATIWIK